MNADAPEEKPFPRWRRIVFGARPGRTLLRLLIVILLIVTLFHVSLMPIKIVGISMAPTYRNGAFSMVNRLSYLRLLPERGDVVAIRGDQEGYYLKRIVALPGERLSVRAGQLIIDGEPLREPYAEPAIPWELENLQLGENEYFVIGDNRKLSSFGVIREEQLVGKVLF